MHISIYTVFSWQIIGIDPFGSVIAKPSDLNKSDVTFFEVEGLGYDFVPTVCEREVQIIPRYIVCNRMHMYSNMCLCMCMDAHAFQCIIIIIGIIY